MQNAVTTMSWQFRVRALIPSANFLTSHFSNAWRFRSAKDEKRHSVAIRMSCRRTFARCSAEQPAAPR